MAKTRGASHKAYYSAYKSQNKYATNRKRKLLKLQKEQPNNTQITEALKNIKYRRKTPGTSVWSHTRKATAKLMKEVVGRMDYNIFNTNDTVAFHAVTNLKSNRKAEVTKVSFRLGARAHDKFGAPIEWN